MVGKIKKIIITGGAGFLGTNIATTLLNNDFKVLSFDNLSSRFSDTNVLKHKNYQFIHGDTRIKNELNIEGDFLVHCASSDNYRGNIEGDLNVIEFCYENKIPFIFLSSNKVYTNLVNKIPITEFDSRYVLGKKTGEYTRKGKPIVKSKIYNQGIDESFHTDGLDKFIRSLYGASKYTGDIFTQEFNSLGLEATILRISFIYGKYQFNDWLSELMIARLLSRSIKINGGGKEVTDALYINDFCELVLLIINNFEEFKHKIFNIGGGSDPSFTVSKLEALNLIDVLDQRAGLNNKPSKISFKPAEKHEHKIYLTNLTKISKYWKPKTVVFAGFEKKYHWLNENINWIKERV